MKDQLIDIVVQRAGIDRGTADKAVDAVMDFLKDDPQRIPKLLGDAGLDIGDIGGSLGKLFGR